MSKEFGDFKRRRKYSKCCLLQKMLEEIRFYISVCFIETKFVFKMRNSNQLSSNSGHSRSGVRPNVKGSGETDPYSFPLFTVHFYQPTYSCSGIKSFIIFRRDMATIQVLQLGRIFIPKQKKSEVQNVSKEFGDFKRRQKYSKFCLLKTMLEICSS